MTILNHDFPQIRGLNDDDEKSIKFALLDKGERRPLEKKTEHVLRDLVQAWPRRVSDFRAVNNCSCH